MRAKAIFSFLLCISIGLSAQQAGQSNVSLGQINILFKAIKENYRDMEFYSMDVIHSSYVDYQSVVPYEKSIGYFMKRKNNYCSLLMGVTTIQNEKIKLSVNPQKKFISISSPDEYMKAVFTQADFDLFSRFITSMKRDIIGDLATYRIEYKKGLSLSFYEMTVNNRNIITRMKLFYEREIAVDSENPKSKRSKPRMEIEFTNIKYGEQQSESRKFDTGKYIHLENGKYALSDEFKDYRLVDMRVKKDN